LNLNVQRFQRRLYSNSATIRKDDEMNKNTEGIIAIIAALIVLFSAMWNPLVSAAVAVTALAGIGIYKLVEKEK
jgi:hypothetical protein